MPRNTTIDPLTKAAKRLAEKLNGLRFSEPVAQVYNPLLYAWKPHETYLKLYGQGPKKVVFIGMNPGPFGMAQTGVPFGEVNAVKNWLKIEEPVGRPEAENPKRRVEGFACKRSEVSGKRLWGLFAERFGTAEAFFKDHFVVNYCPLAFVEKDGRNRVPEKLPTAELEPVYAACDLHLAEIVDILEPEWLIGVGAFAEEKANQVRGGGPARIGRILHPSPSSPAANRGWAAQAEKQLREQGVW